MITSYNFALASYELLNGAVVIDSFYLPDTFLLEPSGGDTEGVLMSEDNQHHTRFLSNAELLSMGFATVALFTTQFDADKLSSAPTNAANPSGALHYIQNTDGANFTSDIGHQFNPATQENIIGKVIIKSPEGSVTQPNIVIGAPNTGNAITAGQVNNVIIGGEDTAFKMAAGNGNTIVGAYNLQDPVTVGDKNVVVGFGNIVEPTSIGTKNVIVGGSNCYNALTGDNNIIFGSSNWTAYDTTGDFNIALGVSMKYSVTGSSNIQVGTQAGKYGITGSRNITIGAQSSLGYDAGNHLLSGNDNVILGTTAGQYGLEGSSNIVIGHKCNAYAYGKTNSGARNILMGYECAHYMNGGGSDNIALGTESGYNMTSCSNNIFVGNQAGKATQGGTNNVAIGTQAGFANVGGNNCVFLGYHAGNAETASNKLHIGAIEARTLLGGDFSTGTVEVERAAVILPVTAVVATALTPVEGLEVNVSTTDATFLTTGKWIYQGAAWKAYTVV